MSSVDRVLHIMERLSRQNPFTGATTLTDPLRPDENRIPRNLPPADQIPFVQQQINLLGYNHLPQTFFNLEKHRSLQSILKTAKEALKEALPIRCLEATFVALYLTQGMKEVTRFPLSFRSRVKRSFYQHIVLVVFVQTPAPRYGALGLSRKRTLMYKPLKFQSLFDLILNYKQEYQKLGHTLIDIKLGLTVPHEPNFSQCICWRFVALRLFRFDKHLERSDSEGLAMGRGRKSYSLIVPLLDVLSESSSDMQSPTKLMNYDGANGVIFAAKEDHDGSKHSIFITSVGSLSTRSLSLKTTSQENFEAIGTLRARPDSQEEGQHSGEKVESPPEISQESVSPNTHTANLADKSSVEEDETNYQRLNTFLINYCSLLPTISKQYNKMRYREGAHERNRRFFLSLEELEDAKKENRRRIECIQKQCSPLDLSTIRLAEHQKFQRLGEGCNNDAKE